MARYLTRKYLDRVLSLPGRAIAHFIQQETKGYARLPDTGTNHFERVIRPCDVLLVEGNQRVSGAIKYLTQSTWSHAAMYVGNVIQPDESDDPLVLIEADVEKGVIGVPISRYQHLNTRICRPLGLTPKDRQKVLDHMLSHLGDMYDLKNIVDLARYLMPTPPVPRRFRRQMISLGSGDPTRAICSSLIAQAFQSVGYPILPISDDEDNTWYIRHHSLFAPRDFDLSPYFQVIKPTLHGGGFRYEEFNWSEKHRS